MSLVTKVMGLVDEYTKAGDYLSLYNLITDEAYNKIVNDESWNIVSSIFSHESCLRKESTKESLLNVLTCIAKRGNPKLMVYAFLEQIERHGTPFILKMVMPALKVSVRSITHKRKLTIEVVLDALCVQLKSTPLPASYRVVAAEEAGGVCKRQILPKDAIIMADGCLVEEGRKQLSSLLAGLSDVVDFGEEFIKEVDLTDVEFRAEYAEFILRLFHFPMMHFLCPEDDAEVSHLCESLVVMLKSVQHNLVSYISDMVAIIQQPQEQSKDDASAADDSVSDGDKHSNLDVKALAFLHYRDFTEQSGPSAVPMVYNATYFFKVHLPLISSMLEDPNKLEAIWRGLLVLQEHLKRLNEGDLHHSFMEDDTFKDLLMMLCQVVMYCSVTEYRRLAINLLSKFSPKFESQGRFKWLLFLLHSSLQPSLHGHIVALCRKQIGDLWDTGDSYFDSVELVKLLEKIYLWPEQSGTEQIDLVDISEYVLSALALAKYILLRDKKKSRLLLMRLVYEQYLKPLDISLNFSLTWYKSQLGRMENPAGLSTDGQSSGDLTGSEDADNSEMNVLVAGKPLSKMTPTEKKQSLTTGLLKLDMINFQLADVMPYFKTSPSV